MADLANNPLLKEAQDIRSAALLRGDFFTGGAISALIDVYICCGETSTGHAEPFDLERMLRRWAPQAEPASQTEAVAA